MPALASKLPESEKLTLNVGHVDLGRIDLLVERGFYANRSDLIRTAIRSLLDRHDPVVRETVTRESLHLGLRDVSRAELETARDSGERLDLRVLGLCRFAADIDAELADAAISRLVVLGALHAPKAVEAVLADRRN